MHRLRAVALGMVLGAVPLLIACPGTDSVLGVTTGTFTYSVSSKPPLNTPGECVASGSGSTNVASDGSFSITFPAMSCSNCTLNSIVSGTLNSTAISGQVLSTTGGSGCSSEAPTPNPTSVSGKCDSGGCSAENAGSDSYHIEFKLTPP